MKATCVYLFPKLSRGLSQLYRGCRPEGGSDCYLGDAHLFLEFSQVSGVVHLFQVLSQVVIAEQTVYKIFSMGGAHLFPKLSQVVIVENRGCTEQFLLEVPTFSITCHRFASQNISIGGAHLSRSCHRLASSNGEVLGMFTMQGAHLFRKLSLIVIVSQKGVKIFSMGAAHFCDSCRRLATSNGKVFRFFIMKVPTFSRSCRRLSSSKRRVYNTYILTGGDAHLIQVGIGAYKGVKTECLLWIVPTFSRSCRRLSSSNGRAPTSSAYRMTPQDQTSALVPSYFSP